MVETVTPELAPAAQTAIGDAVVKLQQAAEAQAAAEAARVGGAAGPVLASFASAMVDGFFALFQAKPASTAGAS